MENTNIVLIRKVFSMLLTVLLILVMAQQALLAQVPRNVPPPGDSRSIDLSNPWEVLAFIVVPVFLIGYLIYTLMRKKKSDDDAE